jgi:UDP-N-acetylmuramoyl-L-alanyl-D-glutamate--2,6-diaminopimelate ligase
MDKILNFVKKFIPKKTFKALQPAYHLFLSWISALWYGWSSEKLIVIGVTGTTGKTTSSYLIAEALKGCGFKTGLTSTAFFDDGNHKWLNDKKMTMIGRFFIQKMLKRMVKNKCQFAVIETTSEGIRQFRHRFINYDHLVFTCLYPEHIESPGSFEKYKEAKGRLFAHLKKCNIKYTNDELRVHKFTSGIKKIDLNKIKKTIVANIDDEYAEYFLSFWAEKKIGISRRAEINKEDEELPESLEIVRYRDMEATQRRISFTAFDTRFDLQLTGEFNAINAMNAITLAHLYEKELNKIKEAIEDIRGVAGRLEKIDDGQNFTVIVDYAFEPNAVEKLYETVESLPYNNIIHVLGSCGGGRDEARRPKLGKIVGERSETVIVTNEDPYDDDPELIIAQVAAGAQTAGKTLKENLFKITDRREAIKKAFSLAEEGDIVLITGKGSEQAICVANREKIPWDDRTVAKEELELLKNKE